MWPFGKSRSSATLLPVDGPWSVAEGIHDGKKMYVRTNLGYRKAKKVPGYDNQVGVAVPSQISDSNGVASSDELAALSEIEELLCSALEQNAESLFVAVITRSDMREFVFYTRNPREVEHHVADLRKCITGRELQLFVQPDQDWRIYARLLPAA